MCTRYGESWCPLSMPRGMWGAFLPYGSPNGAYNTIDINIDTYNTVDTNVGCGALFPQAYRVWSWYRVLTLCAAFSVRPWSLPSGNPRSDGSSRYWPCQSEKSGKQASYESSVGDAGSE